jgi:Zn-finger nucleic acid-binding protein
LTIVLDERTREGVVVDACPECRGIWLDRGELEKLNHRAQAEWERGAGGESASSRRDERGWRHDDDDDDDRHGHPAQRRRGGFLESLGNLFD